MEYAAGSASAASGAASALSFVVANFEIKNSHVGFPSVDEPAPSKPNGPDILLNAEEMLRAGSGQAPQVEISDLAA